MREAALLTKIIQERGCCNHSAHVFLSLQDSFFNDNRDNRDNLCDNVFVSMRSLCFYAKPVVSIVSIVVLIICLAMQISYKE